HWLAIQVEAAKIALSDAPVGEIDLHRIAPELKQSVTREDFDQSIGKLVGKTVSTVQAMLKTAGVAAEAVDTILFAGGSSGVPLLRE
ncbi:Hsp70 family protein, partial [Salmonella sp. gx-h1]